MASYWIEIFFPFPKRRVGQQDKQPNQNLSFFVSLQLTLVWKIQKKYHKNFYYCIHFSFIEKSLNIISLKYNMIKYSTYFNFWGNKYFSQTFRPFLKMLSLKSACFFSHTDLRTFHFCHLLSNWVWNWRKNNDQEQWPPKLHLADWHAIAIAVSAKEPCRDYFEDAWVFPKQDLHANLQSQNHAGPVEKLPTAEKTALWDGKDNICHEITAYLLFDLLLLLVA